MARLIPRLLALLVLLAGAGLSAALVWMSRLNYENVVIRPAEEQEVAERKVAMAEHSVALYSLDELYANLSPRDLKSHAVGMKLEIELFDEDNRSLVEQRQGAIKDLIIQAASEQSYANLNTVEGKLFFKEKLVARINEFFDEAIVRDLHFSSFYLQ